MCFVSLRQHFAQRSSFLSVVHSLHIVQSSVAADEDENPTGLTRSSEDAKYRRRAMFILLYFRELQQWLLSYDLILPESGTLSVSRAASTLQRCDFSPALAEQRDSEEAVRRCGVIYCSANDTEGPVLIGTARGRDFPQPVSCFGVCEPRSKHQTVFDVDFISFQILKCQFSNMLPIDNS